VKAGVVMKYDVIIVGAGASGIFTAYELARRNAGIKVLMVEKGHSLDKRKCPIDGKRIKTCQDCRTCNILNGFGGSGGMSDGKYNITNYFGGERLIYYLILRCWIFVRKRIHLPSVLKKTSLSVNILSLQPDVRVRNGFQPCAAGWA